MESADYDDYDLASAQGVLIAQSWLATVIIGVVTLILGLIVSFHPGGSLNVVAVLARHPGDLLGDFPPCQDLRPRGGAPGVERDRRPGVHRRRRPADPSPAPDHRARRPVRGHRVDRAGRDRADRLLRGRRPRRTGLVDLLRRGERDRRDRRRRHPGHLAHRARPAPRHLVHRHGHHRDHRRAHDQAHGTRRGETAWPARRNPPWPTGQRNGTHGDHGRTAAMGAERSG